MVEIYQDFSRQKNQRKSKRIHCDISQAENPVIRAHTHTKAYKKYYKYHRYVYIALNDCAAYSAVRVFYYY